MTMYLPEPLNSNVYLRIEDMRSAYKWATTGDQDVNHDRWGDNAGPAVSDADIMRVGYEKSRWIDSLLGWWFYPRCMRIAWSFNDLYNDKMFLPAPVVGGEATGYGITVVLVDNGVAPQILQPRSDYLILARGPHEREPYMQVYPAHIKSFDRSYNGAQFFYYNGQSRSYDDIYLIEEWEWYSSYDNAAQTNYLAGTFGFLEDGGVPLPIQRATRYMTAQEIKGRLVGDPDTGDMRSMLKSETTDGHSYTLADPTQLAKYRGEVVITGNHEIDMALAHYRKIRRMRMEIV